MWLAAAMLLLLGAQPGRAQQRTIVNPSFESNDPNGPGAASYQIYPNGVVSGWNSTSGEVELWDSGYNGVPAYDGAVFAEMNASVAGALYQNICMVGGETVGWSFAHRARSGGAATQTARFEIASTGGTVFQTLATQASAVNNVWNVNTGSTVYSGPSGLQRIQFTTTDPGSIGNFLDDIRINLNPFVEFNTAATAGVESIAAANMPVLVVSGTLASARTVNITITGGTAIRGLDYTTPNGAASFTVTIPAGVYHSTAIPLGIAIINDILADGSEIIQMSITAGSGYSIASTQLCGSPPVAATTYTITDDDAAVVVTKNWVNGIAGDTVGLTITGGLIMTPGTSTVSGTATNATATAIIGQTVTITEAFTTGNAANYISTIECRRNIDNAVITLSGSGLSRSFVVPLLSGITCTWTNTRRSATLTLRKTWAGAQTFDAATLATTGFLNNSGLAAVANAANETDSATAVTVYAGETGTISENLLAGNTGSYEAALACTGNTTPLSGTTLSVNPTDSAIVCTYTNTGITPLTVSKTSSIVSDGISVSDHKLIPGATVRYCVLVTNPSLTTASAVTMTDAVPAALTYVPASMASGTNCANATTAEDDNATGADESDPLGMSIALATITGATANLAPGASIALVFSATIN